MSRWHSRFLEDILVFIAELCILRFNHSISSYLVHYRPNQCTPRYSFRITMNQINKRTCENNVNLYTISHLLCRNHNLVGTGYAITTLTNIITRWTTVSAANTISAWFAHNTFFTQTRHSRESIQLICELYHLRKSIPKITSVYKLSHTYNAAFIIT